MASVDVNTNARRGATLSVLVLAQLMVLLDATVINIALASAQQDLHFSIESRQWVITAYAVAFGSFLLLGGRLSDLWGPRRALLVALSGFALASALGGSAQSFAVLIAARALQGIFAALLAPAALAALSVTFQSPKERPRAFTLYGIVAGSGAVLGLLLGGALTQWTSWRWCLYVNLLFAGVAIVGVIIFVKDAPSERHSRLDVVGTVLATGGLLFVFFGLSHALSSSWSNDVTWISLVLGVVALGLFVRLERGASSLVPRRIVANRTRVGSFLALFVTSVGTSAVVLFLAYYLENTTGYSSLRVGVAFLPLVGALALSSLVTSARLLALTGPRPLIPTGMLLAAMGMVLFTRLTLYSNYWGAVLPGLIVTGLGLGLIFAPAFASATAGVERRDAGAVSAIATTSTQIGASLGVALLNTIALAVVGRELGNVAHATLLREYLASLHGYSVAFWWTGALFGVSAVVTLFVLESGPPSVEPPDNSRSSP
ncbi:MAG: MFS transporter [Acidimicrobiales bacterium]